LSRRKPLLLLMGPGLLLAATGVGGGDPFNLPKNFQK
jgi:hypothetical protein